MKVDVKRAEEILLAMGYELEGWRPIETAPKNQAVFVKLISSDIPYAARFDGECWELTWDGYCLSEFDGPTHWQPLPPPPGEKK